MQISLNILFGLLLLLLVSCQNKPYSLITISPNHTYTAQLVERIDPPDEPYSRMVGLKVFSGGKLIVDEPRFSGGDGFDQRFGDAHPEYNWITDSLLRLSKKPLFAESKYDEIFIRNNATEIITYLMINAGSDMLLLFNLQPNATIKVKTQPQTDQGADTSWIGYAGQFANGKRLNSGGVNFKIRGKYHSPANYCVTIRDDEVIVRSRDFEGCGYLNIEEKKKLPVAPDCGE